MFPKVVESSDAAPKITSFYANMDKLTSNQDGLHRLTSFGVRSDQEVGPRPLTPDQPITSRV